MNPYESIIANHLKNIKIIKIKDISSENRTNIVYKITLAERILVYKFINRDNLFLKYVNELTCDVISPKLMLILEKENIIPPTKYNKEFIISDFIEGELLFIKNYKVDIPHVVNLLEKIHKIQFTKKPSIEKTLNIYSNLMKVSCEKNPHLKIKNLNQDFGVLIKWLNVNKKKNILLDTVLSYNDCKLPNIMKSNGKYLIIDNETYYFNFRAYDIAYFSLSYLDFNFEKTSYLILSHFCDIYKNDLKNLSKEYILETFNKLQKLAVYWKIIYYSYINPNKIKLEYQFKTLEKLKNTFNNYD